jgi:hypothetical protein
MTGYQQHFNLQSAGIVDFVPYEAPIDTASLRASDVAADAEWKK